MAQRTGGDFDALDALVVGMGAKGMADGVVRVQKQIPVIHSHVAENGKQQNAVVTLTENENVAVGIIQIVGIKPHILVVNCNRHIGSGHGSSDMHVSDSARTQRQLFADFACLCNQIAHIVNVNLGHDCASFLS